jgi:cytoskeleton protein RodZ
MDRDSHDPNASSSPTTLERLGQALREARLSQGIERSALASKLHMGVEQLSALEDADVSRLPEPVFVIAQARRVADALGTDISQLVAPLKPNDGPVVTATPDARPSRRLSGASPGRRATRRAGSRGSGRKSVLPLQPLAVLALVAGVIAAGSWVAPRWSSLSAGIIGSLPGAGSKPVASVPARPRPVVKPQVVPGLVLRTQEASWLEVRQGPTTLFKGTFSGEKRFPLRQPLRLLAGRPDLVQLSIDGSAPQPLGQIEDIRWVTLQPGQPFQPRPVTTADTTTTQPVKRAGAPTP